jgi:hypothetical protein
MKVKKASIYIWTLDNPKIYEIANKSILADACDYLGVKINDQFIEGDIR